MDKEQSRRETDADEQQVTRDELLEAWLRTEVIAAYEELRVNPGRGISSDELRAHLAELHKQRLGT